MEKTFLLYLSVHWGDLIEQIKKNSVIYTLIGYPNALGGLGGLILVNKMDT